MIEAQIFTALLKKKAWLDYSEVLDWPQLKQQTPEVYRVMLSIKKWHESKDGDLSIDELPIWFYLSYPGMKDKEKEIYNELFLQAAEQTVRDELISQYLTQLKDIQTRRQLAVMAMDDKVSNEKVIDQIKKLSGQVVEQVIDEEYVTTDIEDLIKLEEESPGLLWRLECLNKSIGPLKKGMFGAILARVETGKTAMWVSEVTNMLPQMKNDEHVCIFFNEENGTDVMWRIYSATIGWSAVEVESNFRKARELFYAAGGQKIKFVDRANQTPKSVYKTLDSCNPAVAVIDSLDKIKGFDDERRDTALGKAYQWARETAKIYCPVIGISQAVAPPSGLHKKWLTEMDMADSKTAKPAELDFLIAIGKSDDAGYEYTRYINIPKNKGKASKYKDEKDRHGKFITTILTELSRYEDAN